MKINLLPGEKISHTLIKKKDAEGFYGKHPKERSVDELINFSVVVIDKPSGPTSHQVSSYVRDILHVNKSGHSGTLDPKVTGVLPVASQKATKLNEYLLKLGKEYVCLMHLHKEVEENKIREAINSKVGKISQMPPVRSAVKRQQRQREIYYVEILDIDGQDALFKVGCEAGTYIRKFCHDIGKELGVGGHMQELRRTKAGLFSEYQLTTLTDLHDAYILYKEKNDDSLLKKILIPGEKIVEHLPKVWVYDTAVWYLTHGSHLAVPGITKLNDFQKGEDVAIMTLKGELVGTGSALLSAKEIVDSRKGIAVKMDKITMDVEAFPKVYHKGEQKNE